MTNKQIDVGVVVKSGGVNSALKEVENSVAHMTSTLRTHFGGIGNIVERIKIPIAELGVALGAAFAIKELGEFISKTEELGVALSRASQKTGISTTELGGLKFAAEQAGGSFDSLIKGTGRLALAMQAMQEGKSTPAVKALEAIGVSATDASGKLRPLQDVFLEVAGKFKNMEDGAGKTALAMNIFGARMGAELIPTMNQLDASTVKFATDIDATMTPEQVAQAEEYHKAMGRVGLVQQALSIAIGSGLMPMLTDLANAFVESAKQGGTVHDVLQGLKIAIEVIVVAIKIVVAAFQQIFAVGEFVFNAISNGANVTGQIIHDALTLNFAKAQRDMAASDVQMAADFKKMTEVMVSSAQGVNDAMNRLFGQGGGDHGITVGPFPGRGEAPEVEGKGAKGKKGKDPRIAELAEIRAAAALEVEDAEGDAEKIVLIKQRELKATQALYAEHTTQVLNARRELEKAELAHMKQSIKAADDLIAAQQDRALRGIAIEREAIRFKRQMGEISAADEIAQLNILTDKEWTIKLRAAEAERDLLKENTEAYRKAAEKVQVIMEEYGAAHIAGAHAQTLQLKTTWDNLFSAVNSSMQTSIQGIIQGTTSLVGAWRNMYWSMYQQLIAWGIKSVGAHIGTEIAKTQATTAGATARTSINWWAAAQSVAASVWHTIIEIANSAARAIAAAWAAISAIPYVGPFLAPAIALGTGALVLALGSRVASAEHGYDIPGGINPVTQLHAREMVLPAEYADVIRAMAAGGAAGGSGGNTYHIHAMDAKSFKEFAAKNPEGFATGVNGAVRSGHLRG